MSGKVLPSGTYTITKVNSGTIEIASREMHVAALSRAFTDSRQIGSDGKLVFDRYGDKYFLKEVLCPNAGMNVNLPPSRQEKQAGMREARMRVADEVLVAVK